MTIGVPAKAKKPAHATIARATAQRRRSRRYRLVPDIDA